MKNAIVTGAYTGNVVSYWNSGTTKFDDHTANLPDSTDGIWVASDLMNFPFYGGGNHWAIKTAYWLDLDFSVTMVVQLTRMWTLSTRFGSNAL